MIDFQKLQTSFDACKGRVRYLLGAKVKLGSPAADMKRIDCSGWVRWQLFEAAGIQLPDGSQNQLAWARKNLRKLNSYSDVVFASQDDSRLFIAFLSPKPGADWPRHVWLIRCAKSMESCSNLGVSSRPWNHPSLKFAKECFEVK